MKIKSEEYSFNVTPCRTLFSQIIGLMFRQIKNDGLIFIFKKEKYISLHTLFVFYSIDIIYINKDKKIIKLLKKAKPFTLFIPHTKCKYIIELKDSKNISLKSRISFKDS